MKRIVLALLFVACGDNIVAEVDSGDDTTTEVPPSVNPGSGTDGDIPPDPPDETPLPDAGVPVCEDSHILINGHRHKCRHHMRLRRHHR